MRAQPCRRRVDSTTVSAEGLGKDPPLLSIIVPTRNEADNIEPLIKRLDTALAEPGYAWELIFVDDSDDGTPGVVRRLAASHDHQISVHHREPGQRRGGLGGAVNAGFAKARGAVMVVMDADLQHPPEVIPQLVAPLLSGEPDLVAGSRYGGLGSRDGLDGPLRQAVSLSSRWLAHRLVPASRPLTDPMSGLFALRRSVVEGVELSPEGYKILMEVVARGRWHKVLNADYNFSHRYAGRSKAGLYEGLVFLRHLLRLSWAARSRKPEEPR